MTNILISRWRCDYCPNRIEMEAPRVAYDGGYWRGSEPDRWVSVGGKHACDECARKKGL